MEQQTRSGGRSGLGRLLALALTFAVGYVLGSRRAGESEPWDPEREPTEIAINGDATSDGEGENASEQAEE